MKEVPKAVLLDLDGTLIDTAEFVHQAFEYTLAAHKFPVPDRSIMASYIGQPILAIYRGIAPGCDVEALFTTHADFQQQHLHLVKPFPATSEVLTELRRLGIKLGVVTSRLKNTLPVPEVAGLTGAVDTVVSGEHITNQKPHPESIIKALHSLKVVPSQAWMVGDATVDIEAGKRAEVAKTVGVTYGFGGEAIKNSGADYVIDDIKELLNLISS